MNIDTSKPGYVIAYTAAISAVFTAAIMALNVLATPAIEQNELVFKNRALVEILFEDASAANLPRAPAEMSEKEILAVFDNRVYKSSLIVPETGQVMDLWTGYRSDVTRQGGRVTAIPPAEDVVGYAIRINGVGFWEPIEGYLALGPELTYSRGVVFVRQGETPGLGAKITEEPFRSQWAPERRLRLDPPEAGNKHVYITKRDRADIPEASPEKQRHVDAITGATQTSIAVMRFVNDDLPPFYKAARSANLVSEGPPPPSAPQAATPSDQPGTPADNQ
jgi:Na+-transporting NADH:ubiquinone oxidoreductase subunit C